MLPACRTASQVRRLLEVVLPRKIFTLEEVLQLVKRTQQRNHNADVTHRKRREDSS